MIYLAAAPSSVGSASEAKLGEEPFHRPGEDWGRLANMLAIAATAIGVLHLVGTDTLTFNGFQSTLSGLATGPEVGAEVLLRIHAATFGRIAILFMGTQLTVAMAVLADQVKRRWFGWLMAAGGLFAAFSIVLTFSAGQYTTLSETAENLGRTAL